MSTVNSSKMLFVAILVFLVSCATMIAQKRSTIDNKITKLEKEVKVLSDRINTLDARLSALEVLRAFRPVEELRQAMIQANKDAIIGDLNNFASTAYQYRIRPATMGGGGGDYNGFTIPRRLANNDNAEYVAVVPSDSLIIFTGTSKLKLGTVKATLNKEGRFVSFEYTGEFP